jgi:glyoxylase-like metal-dependent hydrolase (beta-lactamase superfamily II)
MTATVERFQSQSGARVYRLPLDLFPGLRGFAHLVLDDGFSALVDTGSGFGQSNDQLESGLRQVAGDYGEAVDWDSLTHVLISHGHIDHYGGLPFVRGRTAAPVGVHDLDLRVLVDHGARLAVVGRRLSAYLVDAGVADGERQQLMEMYRLNKHLFDSVEVNFTYQAVGMQVGPLELTHVPGHCPGQVVFRLDDLMLTADHVLEGISPHQAPERLSPFTGLAHYLDSLHLLRAVAPQIRLALGGHEGPIHDLSTRLEAIERLHFERLAQVLARLESPQTIAELTNAIFPAASGYHRLLAMEETGAHVEYLENLGYIGPADPDSIEAGAGGPIRYRILQRPAQAPGLARMSAAAGGEHVRI